MPNLSPRRRPSLPQVALHRRQVKRMARACVNKRSRTRSLLGKLNSFAAWDGWARLGVLVAVVGLLFTQQSVVVSQKQVDLTELGLINDRINKAAEQLVSKELLTRIASVQSLQATAARWSEQKQAVDVILSAFVLSGLPPGTTCVEITAPDARQAVDVIIGDDRDRFTIKSLPSPYSANTILHVDAGPENRGPVLVNFPAFFGARESMGGSITIEAPSPGFCSTGLTNPSDGTVRLWTLTVH